MYFGSGNQNESDLSLISTNQLQYLDRALELGREKSKMEELRRRESEEEHRKFEVEQQEKEKERGNKLGSELELQNEEASRRRGDGVYEAGAHKGEVIELR